MAGEKTDKTRMLWEKAIARNCSMHLNAKHDLLEIALEQGHLSVEIAFDAILVECGWTIVMLQSFKHNLRQMVDVPLTGGSTIQERINAAKGDYPARVARTDFTMISSAWRMQFRYETLPLAFDKIRELVPIFERQFQWIRREFDKSVSK